MLIHSYNKKTAIALLDADEATLRAAMQLRAEANRCANVQCGNDIGEGEHCCTKCAVASALQKERVRENCRARPSSRSTFQPP